MVLAAILMSQANVVVRAAGPMSWYFWFSVYRQAIFSFRIALDMITHSGKKKLGVLGHTVPCW